VGCGGGEGEDEGEGAGGDGVKAGVGGDGGGVGAGGDGVDGWASVSGEAGGGVEPVDVATGPAAFDSSRALPRFLRTRFFRVIRLRRFSSAFRFRRSPDPAGTGVGSLA